MRSSTGSTSSSAHHVELHDDRRTEVGRSRRRRLIPLRPPLSPLGENEERRDVRPRRSSTNHDGDGDAASDADGLPAAGLPEAAGLSDAIGLAEPAGAAGLCEAGAELGTDTLGLGDDAGVQATTPASRAPARSIRLITVTTSSMR
jgi:hypothetical protein